MFLFFIEFQKEIVNKEKENCFVVVVLNGLQDILAVVDVNCGIVTELIDFDLSINSYLVSFDDVQIVNLDTDRCYLSIDVN